MRQATRSAHSTSPLAIVALSLLLLVGCATYGPTNPSFDLEVDEAWDAIDEMAANPRTPPRPIVVLSGWADIGIAVTRLEQMLEEAVGDGEFIAIHFAMTSDFDNCRERVIHAVDAAFPNDDPIWTREVDVVAFSMGGLVAHHAAADPPHGQPVRRLNIKRLFTIATPHRGAALADIPTTDQRQLDMRNGSTFLEKLTAELEDADYQLHPYARLGDLTVGTANTAPPGETPWWLPNRRLELAHTWAYRDPRIVADIARRLRGETPFATRPRAPLPSEPATRDATNTTAASDDDALRRAADMRHQPNNDQP